MADEAELWEACLREDTRDEGREVHDAHLADVPCPHAWVGISEHLMLRLEAATVVAKPDVVATVYTVSDDARCAER